MGSRVKGKVRDVKLETGYLKPGRVADGRLGGRSDGTRE
jgi:hypothetical protein